MQAQNYVIMSLIMYQKKDRKKEIARRTLIYATMTVSLVVLLGVLLFMMLGYRFDPTTNTVEQAGLVQYSSFPRGAMVSIDGTNLDKTPAKNMVMPGQHQFAMKLTGYETWQKPITVRSDTVTQLDYARLVPTERKVSDVRDVTGLETAKFTANGRYVVGIGLNEESALISLWGDLRNADSLKFTEQAIDTTLLAGYDDASHPDRSPTKHSFLIYSWSENSRFVIVKHNYTIDGEATKTQWLRFDRENQTKLLNITDLVGFDIADAKFIGDGGDALYVLQSDGSIRRVRLDDSTISNPLVTGVEEFSLYDEKTIVFVASRDETRVAGIWREDWSEEQIVRTLTTSEKNYKMHIKASEYFNKDTVVVSVDETATIYRGALPGTEAALEAFLQTGKKISLGRAATDVSMSDDGRFIILRDDAGFISYDLERASLSAEIVLSGNKNLEWLDDFHVWQVDESGDLLMREFDGANPSKLLKSNPKYGSTLSSDGKYVYTFSETDGELQLQRLAMTVKS